uniref:Uncharacterized protein n=1 Tax=Oryza meridionalis TaxID=40149 RepID=A0A0E0E5A1_9ORYZ
MNILSENQQQLRVRSTWERNYLKTFLLFRHNNHYPTFPSYFSFCSVFVVHRGRRTPCLGPASARLLGQINIPLGNDQFFPEEAQEGEEFYGADEFMECVWPIGP